MTTWDTFAVPVHATRIACFYIAIEYGTSAGDLDHADVPVPAKALTTLALLWSEHRPA